MRFFTFRSFLSVLSFVFFVGSVDVKTAFAQDAAELVVRIGRLENQMRQMSGELEQLRYENKQLRLQLEHVNSGGRTGVTATQGAQNKNVPKSGKDVYDPSEDPNAAGAPKALGTTEPSRPLTPEEQEMKEGSSRIMSGEEPEQTETQETDITDETTLGEENSQIVIEDYDIALDYLQSEHYEKAEMHFKSFLHAHPDDKLVPMAIYGLGQSYAKRNRHREAAEQFVLIATKYPDSETAPDAMIKLGISMDALGTREKACALFAEVKKRYPNASEMVLATAEKERKRARCKN